MKLSRLLAILVLVAALHSVAAAGVIVDRSLPATQANGGNSVVSWSYPGPEILGDDFDLPGAYRIDKVTMWFVGLAAASAGKSFENEQTVGVNLYLGPDAGMPLAPVGYTVPATRVYFTGGLDYNNGSIDQPVWKAVWDLAAFNIILDAGLQNFAVKGLTATDDLLNVLSTQNMSDNHFGYYAGTPFTYKYSEFDGGDINVLIEGTEVPEPSTMGLFALGGALLLYVRRKK